MGTHNLHWLGVFFLYWYDAGKTSLPSIWPYGMSFLAFDKFKWPHELNCLFPERYEGLLTNSVRVEA